MSRSAQLAGEVSAGLLALVWIGFLSLHAPSISQSLFRPRESWPIAPNRFPACRGRLLSRHLAGLAGSIWKLTRTFPPGEWVHVTFELARGVQPRTTLATASVRFERTRKGWPVRLTVDPHLTAAGDRLYLRFESVLSSPRARISYRYSRQNIDPHGAFLNLDQPRTTELDLLMTVYRAPSVPKPLAWIEAYAARAGQAGQAGIRGAGVGGDAGEHADARGCPRRVLPPVSVCSSVSAGGARRGSRRPAIVAVLCALPRLRCSPGARLLSGRCC